MTTVIITEGMSPWGKYWTFKVKGTGQKLAEIDKKRKSSSGYDGYIVYSVEWPSEVKRTKNKESAMEFARQCVREIVGCEVEFKWNVMCQKVRFV